MPVIRRSTYRPPVLLSNAHLSTVLPHLVRRVRDVKYVRERLETPDGDFVDIDWSRLHGHARGGAKRELVVILHGLGGSSNDPYVLGMVRSMNKAGYDAIAMNMRACSGEPNRLPRFFYPGDTPDVDLVVRHAIAKVGYESVHLVSFSMGGNVFLNYAGGLNIPHGLPPEVKKCVAFSTPLDLAASADHLATNALGFYMARFLAKYRLRLREKDKIMPGANDLTGIDNLKTFREFDERFNTVWYGFANADDFYRANSCIHRLENIRIPTLIVNAKNDPFLTPVCFPVELAERNAFIHLEMPSLGGHVGFYTFGGYWSEERAVNWLKGE